MLIVPPQTGYPEKDAIEVELRSYDRRLFLELQIDLEQKPVWTVQMHVAGDKPPELVFEWRTDAGEPLPISHGIVERVRYLMHQGGVTVEEIIKRNQRVREQAAAEASEQYREIGREFHRRRNTSFLIPRSHQLYLSRSKARNRGEQK